MHRGKIKIGEPSPVLEGSHENVTKRRKYNKNAVKASNGSRIYLELPS